MKPKALRFWLKLRRWNKKEKKLKQNWWNNFRLLLICERRRILKKLNLLFRRKAYRRKVFLKLQFLNLRRNWVLMKPFRPRPTKMLVNNNNWSLLIRWNPGHKAMHLEDWVPGLDSLAQCLSVQNPRTTTFSNRQTQIVAPAHKSQPSLPRTMIPTTSPSTYPKSSDKANPWRHSRN